MIYCKWLIIHNYNHGFGFVKIKLAVEGVINAHLNTRRHPWLMYISLGTCIYLVYTSQYHEGSMKPWQPLRLLCVAMQEPQIALIYSRVRGGEEVILWDRLFYTQLYVNPLLTDPVQHCLTLQLTKRRSPALSNKMSIRRSIPWIRENCWI